MSVDADTPVRDTRGDGEKSPAQSPPRPGQVLVWGALGLLLYEAHVAFVPIALALLLALVLSGPVEALHRLRVPRGVSALLILLVTLALIGTTVEVLVDEPGVARSHREAPEIDGIIAVPADLAPRTFATVEITASAGPDLEARPVRARLAG